MPIVNSYQAAPTAVADFAQETGQLQALSRRRRESEARLFQAQRDAENRTWQEAMMDKRATLANQRDAFHAALQNKSRAIQQAQNLEYQRVAQGLQAPENAKKRAMLLEMQKRKLEAQGAQREQDFQRKLQYQEALDQAKVKNYEAMSAAKKRLYNQAINERDVAIAKIEGSKGPNDKDKRRMINGKIADFERIWGHVKQPQEKEDIQKMFESSTTKPLDDGSVYTRNNSGNWELLKTKQDLVRDQRIKAKEAESKHIIAQQNTQAKLMSTYMSTYTTDENGIRHYPSTEDAIEFARKITGVMRGEQPSSPGAQGASQNAPLDYGTIGAKLRDAKTSPEERRQMLSDLQARAQAGDKDALMLAIQIAQEEKDKNRG